MNRLQKYYSPALWLLLILVVGLSGCRKADHLLYEVNNVGVLPVDAEKGRFKSEQQYVAILYANLFQEALSGSQLVDIIDLIASCGDKETIKEVIISSFMNSPNKIIPTEQEMRNNLDLFVEETYIRFLVRRPSQAERTWFKNFIESDPHITPELVYMAFALSDEYNYY
ncbi:MAG TPA: hypothetical protein ENJ82_07000 [Bacteroidetes bacterium]|nr:hypothetical protein [Bacteroidota bacterium]